MPLTDIACRKAACPEGRKHIRLADAGGLYLEVTAPGTRSPQGAKLWRWKYRFGGKEKRLALGVYPQVTLAQARAAHAEARAMLAQGVDGEERKASSCVVRCLSRWPGGGMAKGGQDRALLGIRAASVGGGCFPGDWPAQRDDLTAPDFVRMITKIEARGAGEIARRVMETCGQIMRWAVAHGLVERNPVADVKPGTCCVRAKWKTLRSWAR